jgi:hypothetical protein
MICNLKYSETNKMWSKEQIIKHNSDFSIINQSTIHIVQETDVEKSSRNNSVEKSLENEKINTENQHASESQIRAIRAFLNKKEDDNGKNNKEDDVVINPYSGGNINHKRNSIILDKPFVIKTQLSKINSRR